MRKETEQTSLRAFPRRHLLKLGAGAGALVICKVIESKIGDVAANNPLTLPTPNADGQYRIGVPGVTKNDPSPTSEKPPLSPEMLTLQNRLDAEIREYQSQDEIKALSQIAVAVTNIKTGESIDVNGERPQIPGCVANLFCALTAISEITSGTASYTLGEIEETMTIMVRNSNPSKGVELAKIIGGGSLEAGVTKINHLMQFWGMKNSFFDHSPAYDAEYSARGSQNLFVPNEINRVLTKIGKGELFPKTQNIDWNAYTISVMYPNYSGLNFMIPVNIPDAEAYVAHKVGWRPGHPNDINDVGLVIARARDERGEPKYMFAISCMYQNLESSASENYLWYTPGPLLGRLAGISWQTLAAR